MEYRTIESQDNMHEWFLSWSNLTLSSMLNRSIHYTGLNDREKMHWLGSHPETLMTVCFRIIGCEVNEKNKTSWQESYNRHLNKQDVCYLVLKDFSEKTSSYSSMKHGQSREEFCCK